MSLVHTVSMLFTMALPYLFTPEGTTHEARIQGLDSIAVATMASTDELSMHQSLKMFFTSLDDRHQRVLALRVVQQARNCNELKGGLLLTRRTEDIVSESIALMPQGRRCEDAFAALRNAMKIPMICVSNPSVSGCENWW